MKAAIFILLLGLSTVTNAQRRDRGNGEILDRLFKCQEEKSQLERSKDYEVQTLKNELYQCQINNQRETLWSCQAGCTGLGNVGFGTGRTEAEARSAALKDLGFNCTNHTFECNRE